MINSFKAYKLKMSQVGERKVFALLPFPLGRVRYYGWHDTVVFLFPYMEKKFFMKLSLQQECQLSE